MLFLRKVRLEVGMTQADLMRQTGLHPTTLSSIEHERMKPFPSQAERITDALLKAGWNGEGDLFAGVCDE